MATYRTRPRFRVELTLSPEEALERLRAHLDAGEGPCVGMIRQSHAQLSIVESQQHLWSPQLGLEFVSREEGGSIVHGLVGPSASVWTAFVAGYAILGFLAFVAATFGYVQWTLKQPPWGLKLLGALGVLGVLWYLVSQVGQRFAAAQIEQLRDLFDEVLKESIIAEEDV